MIPSLKWANAYQFFSEVKPPFYQNYKIIISSDPKLSCYDVSVIMGQRSFIMLIAMLGLLTFYLL